VLFKYTISEFNAKMLLKVAPYSTTREILTDSGISKLQHCVWLFVWKTRLNL